MSFFLISVFLLALCNIEDPDAWIHLTMGRMIWDLKGLPANEPFMYPMQDTPFSYSSWLFGLVYYFAYHTFTIYGVILLKATIILTSFYILIKDSLRPFNNYHVSIIVMTLAVLILRPQFVERPDTFLMIFLPLSIFCLNALIYEDKRYIYFLPLIHILWANSHSSINLMVVPFLSFIIGGSFQRYLNNKGLLFSTRPSISQINTILLIFIASFAASLLSPYHLNQYTYGFGFLASDWFKQEIVELNTPTWRDDKPVYFTIAVVIISFALNWLTARRLHYVDYDKKRLSFIDLLTVVPVIFLSLSARRFMVPLVLVSTPIIARNVSAFMERLKAEKKVLSFLVGRRSTALVATWIVLYAALTLAHVQPFGNNGKIFGFGINYYRFPESALRYMDKRNITGRIFNLFEWGQYIEWRDFPKRAAFIDGRGHLTLDLLGKMDLALTNANVLDELHKRYGFESVLISYPLITRDASEYGIDIALSSPKWALVYWDDISLIYLRRNGQYDLIIKEDEYKFVKPANGIKRSRLSDASYLVALINELMRNIRDTGSSKAYVYLGTVYNEIGLYKEALDCFSKVKDTITVDTYAQLSDYYELNPVVDAYKGMAQSYDMLGYPDESIKYYKKSLSIKKDDRIFYNLGKLYLKKETKRLP